MLLQTNSYIVPKEKRAEHARLLARFRQTLARLGCDHFEAYEQVGANWSGTEATGRFVQIMRFRDRKHQQQVQGAERSDPNAQSLIKEFCELINFPYQQQQGLFAVGFYSSAVPVAPARVPGSGGQSPEPSNEMIDVPIEDLSPDGEQSDLLEPETPPLAEQQPDSEPSDPEQPPIDPSVHRS